MITDFHDDNRFLSNFYPGCYVVLDKVTYPSIEHAYQAAKTLDYEQRAKIFAAQTPGQAKKLGRQVKVRDDWDEVKVKIMYELLWQKFTNEEELANRLLATGTEILIEGNNWGDRIWGAELVDGKWVGHNTLGKLLMAIRTVLKCQRELKKMK